MLLLFRLRYVRDLLEPSPSAIKIAPSRPIIQWFIEIDLRDLLLKNMSLKTVGLAI